MRSLTLVLGLALLTLNASATEEFRAPRGPDGIHPDFNGIWQAMNEAHWDVERHMARPSVETRQGPRGPVPSKATVKLGAAVAVPASLGVVEGGTIPYTPAALQQRDDNRANWAERDPEVKCYLPGVPRATYMPFPFQIVQGDKDVFFAYTYANAVRNIYSDDPGPAPIDSWMGQSVLSWEGDTMVLTVTGLLADTWLDRAGNHHTEQLKVVERFTPTGPDHLLYEATIEDPGVYTKPWKIRMPLYRRMEADMQLLDFKCQAFVEELLYGEFRRKPLD
jgi:hypothetical protein